MVGASLRTSLTKGGAWALPATWRRWPSRCATRGFVTTRRSSDGSIAIWRMATISSQWPPPLQPLPPQQWPPFRRRGGQLEWATTGFLEVCTD